MKKILLATISYLFSFGMIWAEEIEIPLEENPNEHPPVVEEPNTHRKPQRRILSNIDSENGVSIPGVETSEILSFELWDESGERCFASFTNDMDFVALMFTLEGDYIVRFITENKTYSGYISN